MPPARRWRFWLLSSFALGCLALSKHLSAEVDPALRSRLLDTNAVNAIEDAKLRPWHLKLSFQLYDEKGQSTETGTIEEWWAGPMRYKVAYTSPSYTSTLLQTPDGRFRTQGTSLPPDILEELRLQAVHPMPEAKDINASSPEHAMRKFGKIELDCIMLAQPIKGIKKVPMGLFPTYCLEKDQPVLRVSFNYGTELIIRNQLGHFQGKELAINITLKTNDVMSATSHIETLQTVDASDAMFASDATMSISNDHPASLHGSVMKGNLIQQAKPIYPASAKQNHISGTVVLQALIGKDGRVHSLVPLEAPDPDLTIAAIAAVRQWRYKPYLLNGEPTEIETTISVNFNIGP